jgi:hypothetical protein
MKSCCANTACCGVCHAVTESVAMSGGFIEVRNIYTRLPAARKGRNPGRRHQLNTARLEAMIEEATVDATVSRSSEQGSTR